MNVELKNQTPPLSPPLPATTPCYRQLGPRQLWPLDLDIRQRGGADLGRELRAVQELRRGHLKLSDIATEPLPGALGVLTPLLVGA